METVDGLDMLTAWTVEGEYLRETELANNGAYTIEGFSALPMLMMRGLTEPDQEDYQQLTSTNPDGSYGTLLKQIGKYLAESGGKYEPDFSLENLVPITAGALEREIEASDKVVPDGLLTDIIMQLTRPTREYMEAVAAKTETSMGHNPNPAAMGYGQVPKPYASRMSMN